MKKTIALLMLVVLSMTVFTSAAFALTEDEILAYVEANEGKYEAGSPLTKDDFLVYTSDERIEQYDNDLLVQMSTGTSWWAFWGCTQKSVDLFSEDENFSMSYTYRGIILEDRVTHSSLCDKESVLLKYGIGVEGKFVPKTDALYTYCKAYRSDKVFAKCLELLEETDSWLLYNYKDAAQIKFYFDSDGLICFAGIYKGIQETADKETIRTIQEYLNANGYDCGTPDGIAGKKTKAALSKFQEDHGLFASGYIDDSLMKYLDGQL